MRQRASLVILSIFVVLLAAACGGGGRTATLQPSDVAVVGGQTITKDDLSSLLNRAKKSYAAQHRPFPKPGSPSYESLKSQAVIFLVQRAEFEQKAADMGVHISDKDINARIEQLKKQFYGGSEKKYEQTLKQQGLTLDQARTEVKAQLISEKLYNKVTGSAHVSNDAIKKYYDSHKSLYRQKASRDVRHILVKSPTLANKLYFELVANHEKNFESLAKKYSQDPGSKNNGGKLTIVRGQTVPPFDKVAFTLKTNEISAPVHTQYGWHIIQALSDVKPATTSPLDKNLQASIRLQLEQQEKNTVMTKWVDDVKKEFCKPGKVKYQAGFAPSPDPCLAITSSTATS